MDFIGGNFVVCLAANLRPRYTSGQDDLIIQTSNNVFHQVTSRIFAIYLREVLGYQHVMLQENDFPSSDTEMIKLFRTLENIVQ